jgi:hypothetical protein
VFILKIDKVLCFEALLQVLILKVVRKLTRIEQNWIGNLAQWNEERCGWDAKQKRRQERRRYTKSSEISSNYYTPEVIVCQGKSGLPKTSNRLREEECAG